MPLQELSVVRPKLPRGVARLAVVGKDEKKILRIGGATARPWGLGRYHSVKVLVNREAQAAYLQFHEGENDGTWRVWWHNGMCHFQATALMQALNLLPGLYQMEHTKENLLGFIPVRLPERG